MQKYKICTILAIIIILSNYLYALTDDAKLALDEQRLMQQRNQIEEEKRRLLKKQEEIEKIRQTKIIQPEIKKEKEIKPTKEKIFVKEINVSGVTIFSPRKIRSITSKYTNQELSKTDIGNLQIKLQNLYMQKGYIVARVYLDFKELPQGILKIVVLEGIISKIYFANPKESSFPLFTAFPFLQGNVLNIRDIEQGLEQMNRLQSNNATMKINPSEKEGETEIEIINKKSKTTRLSFGADNSGSKATSEYRANTGLQIDNLFRLNDNLNLNYSQGLEDEEIKGFYSKSYSGSISLPFGYWTVNGSYSQSLYLTTIQGLTGKVRSKGDSENKSFGLERLLFRGQKYKFSLGSAMNIKDTNSFLNDLKLEVGSRRLVPAEFYMTNTLYLPRGTLFVKANYNRGLDTLDAKKDVLDIAKGQPRAQYETFGISGYITERFYMPMTKFPLNYMMNFKSQYSWNDLFGSEQFSPSVRGFKDGGLSGESGYGSSNDIKTPFINILPFFESKFVNNILASCSLGLFYDIGSITPQTYGRTEIMSGWGATFSGNFGKYVSLSISLANTIDVPTNVKDENNVVSLSLNASIPIL
jgi:hemolysin activation/secretion protein